MKVSATATIVVLSFLSASAIACARTACAAKGSAGALGGSAAQAATAGLATTPVRVTSIISNTPAAKGATSAPAASKATTGTTARSKKLASAKRTRHRGRGSRYHYGTYFVPPPPAYAPQSLPELHFPQQVQPELIEEDEAAEEEATAKTPAPTYKKYIFVRDDSLAPKVLEHHKGVTVWRNRY